MKLIKFIALVLCATQFHLVHSQYARLPVGGRQLDALTETHATLVASSLRPGAYLLAVQT